jgi:phenylalanyl-tRNA synthetase alpha chain
VALERIVGALGSWCGLQADVVRRSPVVSIAENYDLLFYPPEALARSTRYSHYVDDTHILRTHTTAAIPRLLRETVSDRFLVCPGLVYRRDVLDRLHVGEPHQVDLWIARKARVGRADLQRMIELVVQTLLPGHAFRCNETWHPYTVNGLEVEVAVGDRWVELLECGEIHPWLLNDAGLPSQEWSGLAMGIGLDRLVMLLKGMDDIRLLRSHDPRVARQMVDLAPWQAVSRQPATRRDMSICVADPDMELIGDRIRAVLGERADWVEDVELKGQSAFDDTPDEARRRLGMQPGQVNLLIRVTLRALDRSITREDAGEVYDLVYADLHEGVAGYLRSPETRLRSDR